MNHRITRDTAPNYCHFLSTLGSTGPDWDTNGEWRKLYNEELHSLFRSPNIERGIKCRRLRWAGHVARLEDGKSYFTNLTGKRPSGKPRRRWENNIRMNLKEIDINTRN